MKNIEYSKLTGMWFVRFNGYCTEAIYTREEALVKLESMS
jgi:hypothetical protein